MRDLVFLLISDNDLRFCLGRKGIPPSGRGITFSSKVESTRTTSSEQHGYFSICLGHRCENDVNPAESGFLVYRWS